MGPGASPKILWCDVSHRPFLSLPRACPGLCQTKMWRGRSGRASRGCGVWSLRRGSQGGCPQQWRRLSRLLTSLCSSPSARGEVSARPRQSISCIKKTRGDTVPCSSGPNCALPSVVTSLGIAHFRDHL